MNLGKEFNPYPKEKQLRKVPKKKKKEVYKGRVIPKKKERTKISKTNYLRMIEEFGDSCLICNRKPIEAHHLVFRSQFGSGNWRNLAPLCKEHHMKAHKDYNFAEYLRQERAERFGPHFWKDKYTLFKEGLIPNTTTEAFEKFLEEEEKERAKLRLDGMAKENHS
jgi:hypothetical protein